MTLVLTLAVLSVVVFAVAFHVARNSFDQVTLILLLVVCGWLLFLLSVATFFRSL